MRDILMCGTRSAYNPDQDDIARPQMLSLTENDRGPARIANRVFETRLHSLFLSDGELKSGVFAREGAGAKSRLVRGGRLNMRLVLERFVATYHRACGPLERGLKEKDGREQFLLYLMPMISGTGNCCIEAQARDQTRADVVADYRGEQLVVELKIWRGPRYNAGGERQVSECLGYFGLATGHTLSFSFNKRKTVGVSRVEVGGKVPHGAIV